MAIAYRSQASQANASRTTTTVAMPAGVQAGDVVLVFCSTGGSGLSDITITPPASLSANPVTNRSYSDTSPAWTVNMRVWRYTVVGTGDPASFAFTHASASSEALAIAFSGVDPTTPLDATPATNSGASTTATMTGLTTVTADAMLVGYRGSWDGNAITPPAGWAERLDQPVTWVGTQTWASPSATGNFSIPAGNGGSYPYGTMLVALRPASEGPAPIAGGLTASTPGLTVAAPTLSATGTASVPVYSGSPAASTPAMTAGPPTASISGDVTVPTWSGSVAASLPELEVGPPASSISGTAAAPTYSGSPSASLPELEVGPPSSAIGGTFDLPAGDGSLNADLPEVTVGSPTMSASGTITAPVYAGDLAASAPEVILGPPAMAATGTSTPPTYGGVLAASTPEIAVGPSSAAITGTVHTLGDNDLVASLPAIVVGPPTAAVAGAVAAPVYAGSVAAGTPTVTVGPPAVELAGTVQAPVVAGTMAAQLPVVTIGPLAAQIVDTSIPPLPISGVTVTIVAGTRTLAMTSGDRKLEVET